MSKLYLNEPLKSSDGPIVVSDEQHNDVAEFFHDEESTVKVTYTEALIYAQTLIKAEIDAARVMALVAEYGATCLNWGKNIGSKVLAEKVHDAKLRVEQALRSE